MGQALLLERQPQAARLDQVNALRDWQQENYACIDDGNAKVILRMAFTGVVGVVEPCLHPPAHQLSAV